MNQKLRGVNLGGWLVLEKWMTPSLFHGLHAIDETRWCVEMGGEAGRRLREHRENFITESDFQWLADRGLNAVRIPVPFWLFDIDYPYHESYGGSKRPFVPGADEYLNRAFDWAAKHGLKVVVDLHTAPGCQNGFDNGGIQGVCDWHKNEEYRKFTLDLLEKIGEVYGDRSALVGIEILNEPRWDIPEDLLKDFTQRAYERIRRSVPPTSVAVAFNGFCRDHGVYRDFMREPKYSNVVYDIHRYQNFDEHDRHMDIFGHIQKAAIEWKNEAQKISDEVNLWTWVGEWSLGFGLDGKYNQGPKVPEKIKRECGLRAYGAAQLLSFEQYSGWFFWSYKTEDTPDWSFRECVERGWLPGQYD